MPFSPRLARSLAETFGTAEILDRARRLAYPDAGHGYDQFGLNPDFVSFGETMTAPIYEKYFRVQGYGVENVPKEGPGILASNHSGTLPIDGMMMYMDVYRHTDPPRVLRPVADYFVSSLPMVSTFFARCGVVGGSRGNAKALLEKGELLQIFPEGTKGIGKPWAKRYQLQSWSVGHCEMAIRHSAPVIPVAVIGAEEQMPQIFQIPVKMGAIPYIPIPATLVPFPTKYHILYGEPLAFHKEFSPDDADNAQVLRECAARSKKAVEGLIAKGLKTRKGVFR